MTPSEIILNLNSLNQLFLRGETSTLAQKFDFPLPIYLEGLLLPFRSSERFTHMMQDYREAALQAGTRRIATRLLQVEDNTPENCLALVRLDYLDDAGDPLARSEVRYAFRQGDLPGMARIELVEYLHASFRAVPLRYVGNGTA